MQTYYELPCLSKANEVVWVGQNVRLDVVDGQVRGFYCLARDITDLRQARDLLQKAKDELEERVRARTHELLDANDKLSTEILEKERAEQALSEQFQFLQRLIDTIPNPIYYKNNADIYVGCNRAFETYMALPRDRIINRLSSALQHLEPVVVYQEEGDLENAGTQFGNHEARVQHRDGKIQNVLINKATYFDQQQQPAGQVSVIIDITERKSLESKLLQSQKLESVGSLAAGIAHEINTPIQFIGDNTRFLWDCFNDFMSIVVEYRLLYDAALLDGVFPELIHNIDTRRQEVDLDYLIEEVPQAIEQTLEGVEHVARIVRSMKEFTHPGVEEKIETDINRAIENTITVARNEWKYSAEMRTNFGLGLPMVPLHVGEFNQVVLNLIINAVHAIADGRDRPKGSKGVITIETRQNGSNAEVRITDNGTGIPEKIRDRVFDPFFTTKEVGRGTGQGLSVSRSVIVDKHGGQLTFETESGVGTTFIIQIPLTNTERNDYAETTL